jgi:sugar phosphate isomerase/epimerase
MKLSWATPEIDALPLAQWERIFAWLTDNGYAGIEPIIAGVYKTPEDEILKLLERYQLKITGFRTGGIAKAHHVAFNDPCVEVRLEAVDRFNQVVQYAAAYGTPKMLVGLMQGMLAEGQDIVEAKQHIRECMEICCDYALTYGIEVDLEAVNHNEINYHNTVADVAGFIKTLNKSNLHLLIDTYHMHLEESSIEEAVRAVKGQIGHVHLADSNHMVPPTGTFNFPAFFGLLAEAGYHSAYTLETVSDMTEENITGSSRYVRSLVK